MTRTATCAKNAKPFIVDVPASLLKRSTELSRDARTIYMTMRALANGRTGELAIRGNPLDWRYIARQAEMGRDRWQRAVKELIAAGYVTRERERVRMFVRGRMRVVFGRARYFVTRQAKPAQSAKTAKTPRVLLMPDSSTVEESGTQIFSETPRGARPISDGVSFQVSGSEREHAKSSSPAKTGDDAAFSESLIQKAKTILERQHQHPRWESWQIEAACWTVMVNAFNSGKVPRSPQYFVAGTKNLSTLEVDVIRNWSEENFRAWLAHIRENLARMRGGSEKPGGDRVLKCSFDGASEVLAVGSERN